MAVDGPVLEGRRLVRVRLLHRLQDVSEHAFLDHELELPLLHMLHAALFAEERMRALQRAELSGPLGLPAAGIVVAVRLSCLRKAS